MVSQYQSVMKQVNTYEDALREAQDLAQQLAAANKTAAAATMLRHNAWVNGSFYLVAMLSVLALLAAISTVVKLVLLPVLIIGGILAVTVIGALQLRNDDQLSQENFISLMGLTFRELPLVRIWYRRPRPPG
jgi:hypothetical protein